MGKSKSSKKKELKAIEIAPTEGAIEERIIGIYREYYDLESVAFKIVYLHSQLVARKALEVVERHPKWALDATFIYEAAMLHDVGIYLTDAPSIGCYGREPYIRHGVLGAELLREKGMPKHAQVCERHTGVGLTLQNIIERELPLPHREMVPISLEEQVICFADCFYSKSGDVSKEKSVEQIAKGLQKHGEDQVVKFATWCKLFL